LVVNGNVSTDNGTYAALRSTGVVATNAATATPTSIWATDRIVASEFNATSDSRIKQNVVPVQNALSVLFLLLLLLFIMNKQKLKYQQIEFDQKILSFQLDKNNSEKKLKETHNSLASYKTYLSEKTKQVEQLKEEIAKKYHSTSANNRKEVFKQ
jgi:hypothetical protein